MAASLLVTRWILVLGSSGANQPFSVAFAFVAMSGNDQRSCYPVITIRAMRSPASTNVNAPPPL